MKTRFESYLIKKGYRKVTPSGNKSTVQDYCSRIDWVCKNEGYTWTTLAQNIGAIVSQYDIGGKKEDLGNKSHRAVINALKQFQEFCLSKDA